MMETSGASYLYRLNSELLENERIFKLSSARLSRDNSLVITLLVRASDYDRLLTGTLREKVENITRHLVPSDYNCIVLYEKTISDESYVKKCVTDFFYNESPLVFRKLSECNIAIETGYDTIRIGLSVPAYIYSFLESNNYADKLTEFLDSKLMESIDINLFIHPNTEGMRPAIAKHRKQKQFSVQKIVEVSDLESIVGAITKMPKYISDAAKAESENQTICGKISGFSQKTAKSNGKTFFTFRLDDTTSQMDAVYFPKDDKAANSFAAEIRDGMTVCAEGPVSLSKFSNTFTMQIRRISRCKINYDSIQNDTEYLEEDEDYIYVSPMPYIEEEQASLFECESGQIGEALKGDYVVFDFETTGLNPNTDKIIEIGAVKIRDGILVETFSTLINPQIPIPPEASETNHIYDEDVAGKPTIEEVIGDFYKFTRGATLVGHNIETFDCNFLYFWGKQNKYNFDNPTKDTIRIAREKLPPGTKMNLSALCKRFDIPLLEAHRALQDSVATAKLFKKLIVL
jgi:DNA polymerase III epsilon subunit family exonuclease